MFISIIINYKKKNVTISFSRTFVINFVSNTYNCNFMFVLSFVLSSQNVTKDGMETDAKDNADIV